MPGASIATAARLRPSAATTPGRDKPECSIDPDRNALTRVPLGEPKRIAVRWREPLKGKLTAPFRNGCVLARARSRPPVVLA